MTNEQKTAVHQLQLFSTAGQLQHYPIAPTGPQLLTQRTTTPTRSIDVSTAQRNTGAVDGQDIYRDLLQEACDNPGAKYALHALKLETHIQVGKEQQERQDKREEEAKTQRDKEMLQKDKDYAAALKSTTDAAAAAAALAAAHHMRDMETNRNQTQMVCSRCCHHNPTPH